MLDFHGARLENLILNSSTLKKVSFFDGDLKNAIIRNSSLDNIDFSGANLENASFSNVQAQRCYFMKANVIYASFSNSTFKETIFSFSFGEDMRIISTSMEYANFSPFLSKAEIDIYKNSFPDSYEKQDYFDTSSNFKARGLFVRNSNLKGANFSNAYLYRSFFTGDHVKNMILDQANFSNAILIQSYIAASARESNFSRALCAYTRLSQTDFEKANLKNTSLYQATMIKNNIKGANLKGVKPPVFLIRDDRDQGTKIDKELLLFLDRYVSIIDTSQKGST